MARTTIKNQRFYRLWPAVPLVTYSLDRKQGGGSGTCRRTGAASAEIIHLAAVNLRRPIDAEEGTMIRHSPCSESALSSTSKIL